MLGFTVSPSNWVNSLSFSTWDTIAHADTLKTLSTVMFSKDTDKALATFGFPAVNRLNCFNMDTVLGPSAQVRLFVFDGNRETEDATIWA